MTHTPWEARDHRGRPTHGLGPAPVLMLLLGLTFGTVPSAAVHAQTISGRVVDSANLEPVGLAAVFVLDAERNPVGMGAADVEGGYSITLPGPGEYYLIAERLGYFETESPLLAVRSHRDFGVDLEMRPEPFRLDPLEVTVSNESLEDFLTLEFGQHPASIPGYRSIQGIRLQEARMKARDNTDFLRWLYIPVSHGRQVCVGTFGAPLPERMSYERTNARTDASSPTRQENLQAQCGALYVDGYRCRNEHLEEIPLERIAVVVTLRSSVRMYTREFDWSFKPGGYAPGC